VAACGPAGSRGQTVGQLFPVRQGRLACAAGAAAARSGWRASTATYTCQRRALEHAIPDPTRTNADFDYDRAALEFIGSQIMLGIEVDFVTDIFKTSTWTGSSTGSDLTASPVWSNAASTPIEDVWTQKQALKENNAVGDQSFKLILGYQVYKDLINHPDIIDRIKYGQTAGAPAIATTNLMAQLFGVDDVLVAGATRNTAQEEDADSFDFVVTQARALLISVPNSPAPFTPSAAYNFVWNDAGVQNGVENVYRYRDDRHESDVIGSGFWFDFKVVAGAMGAFWTTATS
jgi:hypothetical protein